MLIQSTNYKFIYLVIECAKYLHKNISNINLEKKVKTLCTKPDSWFVDLNGLI